MRAFLWVFGLAVVACLRAIAAPELMNGVNAIVNESVITYREVQEIVLPSLDVLRRTYAGRPELFEQKRDELVKDTLDQLVEKELVLDDFKKSGNAIPEYFIDDEVQRRIRTKWGDRVTLTKTLQAQGITFETFRQRIREEIIIYLMGQRNISSALIISPAKIDRYYQTNMHQFQVGDQVKLRMIVLNRPSATPVEEVKSLATEIHGKLGTGTPFAEMASVYSEGSQRKEGGDWGWVEGSKLNKGLSEIAFSLQPGQHSPILALARDTNGYWIYRHNDQGQVVAGRKYTDKDSFVEEKAFNAGGGAGEPLPPQEYYLMLVEQKRAARTKLLPEVRDEIEKTLTDQEARRLHKRWIDRLKKKAFIRFF